LKFKTTLITCSACKAVSNVEVAGLNCWRCDHRFSDEELVQLTEEPMAPVPPAAVPRPTPLRRRSYNRDEEQGQAAPRASANVAKARRHRARANTEMGAAEIIGGAVGVAVFFTPIILLLNWCSSPPAPPSAAEVAKQAEADAEARVYGQRCLSGWDGSHPKVVEAVKRSLRDPASYEHIETRTSPVDATGHNVLMMKFRARNGFGGMNVGMAKASIDNSTCNATIEQIES
jgi:hypothetical protein